MRKEGGGGFKNMLDNSLGPCQQRYTVQKLQGLKFCYWILRCIKHKRRFHWTEKILTLSTGLFYASYQLHHFITLWLFLLSILHSLFQCNFTLCTPYIYNWTGRDELSMYFHLVSDINFFRKGGVGGQEFNCQHCGSGRKSSKIWYNTQAFLY